MCPTSTWLRLYHRIIDVRHDYAAPTQSINLNSVTCKLHELLICGKLTTQQAVMYIRLQQYVYGGHKEPQ